MSKWWVDMVTYLFAQFILAKTVHVMQHMPTVQLHDVMMGIP